MHLFQQQQYYNTNDQENYNYNDDDDTQNYADLADQYYANENQGQYEYQQQSSAAEFYNDPSQQQQQYYNNSNNNNEGYNEQPPSPSLLITSNMQEELQRATSNIDVPLDYLALARQRAMERRASTNSLAGDTDWLHLANEKKKQQRTSTGEDDDDDWVASLADEGAVSDLLSVVGVRMDEGTGMMVTESGIVVDIMDVNNNDDDGPRLLL
jgi:hypothetical protein